LAGQELNWIVPSGPGGGYDAYSRLLQPFLEAKLAARIIIENRPEAGGIVGALKIRDAAADGRTLGIVNASGLLAARSIEGSIAPDLVSEFSVIGRVTSNHYLLFSGRDSGLHNIDDLLQAGRTRPIVVGVRDAGSASFYVTPVTAKLLGFNYALVSGYSGGSARTLAVIRGEVDIVFGSLDSQRGQIKAGELVPLLQLNVPAGSRLNLPRLDGQHGLARQRAAATGMIPDEAEQASNDLAVILGAGRLVVGPRGLPIALFECLNTTLSEVLQSGEMQAAADRAQLHIDHEDGAAAYRGLLAAERGIKQFSPLIQAAIAQARQ
jgi:tripartite-type tricarboxylate transporter receptor subunit TctC